MANLTHDQLAEDLAAHLAGYSTPMVVWTDMQLGPQGSSRPDVYTIEKTYTALRARVFEVKVSRSDFLSDVTSGKYLRYQAYAGSVTFATPAGLVSKAEVPKGCGLITRSSEGVWRYQKKPTLQRTPDLPRDAWLKLVIDGCARERENQRLQKCAPKFSSEWMNQKRMREMAGDELGAALANRDNMLRRLQDEGSHYEQSRKEREESDRKALQQERDMIASARADAAEALGLPKDSAWWEIRRELDQRVKGSAESRIKEALDSMQRASNALEQQREALERLVPQTVRAAA